MRRRGACGGLRPVPVRCPGTSAGLGSVLLLPEVLSRPLRDGAVDEVRLLLAAGATLADVDRSGITVIDRIQSHALRSAVAAGA